jgi:membrane protein DedA with SNARE-associated domain
MYQLSYVKYSQFIILTFIADLHWATGLWTMGVMLDNNVLLPLPHPIDLTKVGTMI